MDAQLPSSRTAFARQPARILLIDFTPPFSLPVCQGICTGLDNLFTMVCNMAGPCRVPYFGLFALGPFSENLFPLQYVPGNYPRIQNALEELRAFQRDGFLINEKPGFLLQAVQDALQQFMKQSHTLRQTTGFSSQVEVSLMTSQKSANLIAKQIEEAISGRFDVEHLRRIQVVSLARDSFVQVPLELSPDLPIGGSQRSSASSEGVLESGIVELVTLETDDLSIQNFFNGWLHDCSTDKEYLYIEFPSGVAGGPFKLTCDIQERFIDPTLLAVQQNDFTLGVSSATSQKVTPSIHSKTSAAALAVAIPTLRVLQLVRISGICESVVFGVPLILRPTACWKLPWDELERNQQHFQALCHLLQQKGLAILVRKDLEPSPGHPGYQSVFQHPPPSSASGRQKAGTLQGSSKGHFLIYPSEGASMMIKPVAAKELMLPSDVGAKSDPPLSNAVGDVERLLDTLEVADVFNPLLIPSGIQASLKKSLSRGSGRGSGGKATRRPGAQLEVADVFNPLLIPSGIQASLKKSLSRGSGRGSGGKATRRPGAQASRSLGMSRTSRGQVGRGQRSRGQATSRGMRGRGRGASTPLRSVPIDYRQPPAVVKDFEHFFPDIED